jgi:hypothetical protein
MTAAPVTDLAQRACQRREVDHAVPWHDHDVVPNRVAQVDVLNQIT